MKIFTLALISRREGWSAQSSTAPPTIERGSRAGAGAGEGGVAHHGRGGQAEDDAGGHKGSQGQVQATTDLRGMRGGTVVRADVARFVADQLASEAWLHKAPRVRW